MQLIFEGILLCIGIYWFGTSVFTLPLWRGNSIAGGMFPAFASGVLILLLLFRIISALRSGKVNKAYFAESFKEIDWKSMIPLAIGIVVVVGIKFIGMFLTLTIMLFCWLKFLSKYGWLKSLIVTVCVMAVLYAIFVGWLVVPLPKGMLGLI